MLQALDINCILINSNVKLFEEVHPEWTTTKKKEIPGWTQVELIWVAFFCLGIVFIYARTQRDGRTRPLSFRAAQGRDSAQEKKRAEKFNSRLGLPSKRHCVVYCIWNCRLSTYCIYYQPPPALKPAAKTKLWTIRQNTKRSCSNGAQMFSMNSRFHLDFIVNII